MITVTVANPDDFMGSPAYDGPADAAWTKIVSGAYWASDEHGAPGVLLVIRTSHATGASLFVPATTTVEA